MADENVVAAGKSKEEIAYLLMHDMLIHASDKIENPTRLDYIKHYAAARCAVSGVPNGASEYLTR